MKRLIATVFAMVMVGSSLAFAAKSKEFDLNFYLKPAQKAEVTLDDSIWASTSGVEEVEKLKQKFGFGLDLQWAWFFGSPADWLDIGLNFSWDNDFYFKVSEQTKSLKISGVEIPFDDKEYSDSGFGFNTWFILGPAFRFNFGKMISVFLSPGFRIGVGAFGFEGFSDGWLFITPSFNLDVGCRVWFTERFGLSVGTDLYFGGGRIFVISDFDQGAMKGKKGFGADIYLGFAFKKGGSSGKNKAKASDADTASTDSDAN